MMGKPPPSPLGGSRQLDLFELRIDNLRRELDAEREPALQAALLYHIGSLYEHERGRVGTALEHYAQAAALAPRFLPAAIARMRLAERGDSDENACNLYRELAETTDETSARATALLDLALHSERWPSLLREAIECAPEPYVPALMLEWLADAHQDRIALREALHAQARCAEDPVLRAALWLDLALAQIEDGDIEAGIRSLDLACESDSLVWSARAFQRRTARAHGITETWRDASIALAKLLEEHAPDDSLDASISDEERIPMAAFLWEEAARLSAKKLQDTATASTCLESALTLRPDDRRLRREALMLAEASKDEAAIDAASSWFARHASSDPGFVAFRVRRAASRMHDPSALEVIRASARDYPESTYVEAALDVALERAGCSLERADRLRRRARTRSGSARARLLWRAAQLFSAHEGDAEDPQPLYVEAAEASKDFSLPILRDALHAALRQRRPDAVLARAAELLSHDLSDEERARLSCLRYAVTQHGLRDEMAARRLLLDSLDEPACRTWAPHVARARAALADDANLLARAHETLADESSGDDEVGHWCAASRAHLRARDSAAAERALRRALAVSPADANVLHALEQLLREQGRPEEIVAIAGMRAQEQRDTTVGESSLVLAGAAAERKGDLDSARLAYEQALRQTPSSASAALALAELARRQRDPHARIQAYDTLARTSLPEGARALFALMRGDAMQAVDGDDVRSSDAYEEALGHPDTAAAAAAALLCAPWPRVNDGQRANAEKILTDAGVALSEPDKGFASAYATLRAVLGQPDSSAGDAWLELSSYAPNGGLAAATMLQGLREIRLSHGERTVDDLFMLAQSSELDAADHPDMAIAIDEVLAPGDDPEQLAAALGDRLTQGGEMGRGALQAARCRVLVEAGRGDEAVALTSRILDERPDDLALWETLRMAARRAGQWTLVAQACERLAAFVDGELKADLLEEAGAVRLDYLEQHSQAEDAFRAALEADPTRELAFRRLHDLLARREDADALEALISSRLASGDGPDRPDLLYERARLLRGFSDRPGALEVLDELFVAEPAHSGALALAAEVHVSLEHWEEAVDCLRRLAQTDIPDDQRRLAHLGAADFLERHLGADNEALIELRAVAALGLADVEDWLRIGRLEEAVGDAEAAADAYRQVLETDTVHLAAVERLQELVDAEERLSILDRFEAAVWSRIESGHLDSPLLEGLQDAASWRGHSARASAVAAARAALDGVEPSEGVTSPDFSDVPTASIWNPESSTVIDQVIRIVGTTAAKERIRSKSLDLKHPLCAEFEHLCETHGARCGPVGVSHDADTVSAYLGRDDEIHWVIPSRRVDGLEPRDWFRAGQLAWAIPLGAGELLDEPAPAAAGLLVAVLRAAHCRVQTGGPVLPATSTKLRRAVRKGVHEVAADAEVGPSDLLATVRRIHRTADRAGLLASGDIAASLASVCDGEPTLEKVGSSTRARELLRFWMADDSPLWSRDV